MVGMEYMLNRVISFRLDGFTERPIKKYHTKVTTGKSTKSPEISKYFVLDSNETTTINAPPAKKCISISIKLILYLLFLFNYITITNNRIF